MPAVISVKEVIPFMDGAGYEVMARVVVFVNGGYGHDCSIAGLYVLGNIMEAVTNCLRRKSPFIPL